jgi:diaphanous 1
MNTSLSVCPTVSYCHCLYSGCAKVELDAGVLSSLAPVQPFLKRMPLRSQSQRHYSSFPLTSHLHTPHLRLVSLHPHLMLPITFLRVPEIIDGFSWSVFLARSTTVEDALDVIREELGLTKVLDGPGGGIVDYIMEEVWEEGSVEGMLVPV